MRSKFFSICVLFLVSGHSAFGIEVARSVVAPCNPDESKQSGLRSCGVVLPQEKKRVHARIKQQVDGYYAGCDNDPYATEIGSACQGKPYPKTTCNPFSSPGTFSGQMEEGMDSSGNNHQGEYCGNWLKFHTSISGRTCRIQPDMSGTHYERENSFRRGAWIHSINCFHEQVRNEVGKGKLNLSKFGTKEGPCLYIAKEFDKLQADSAAFANQNRLLDEANIKDVENCAQLEGIAPGKITAKGIADSNIASNDPDAGKRRQSACQLVTARTNLEAMFAQLAVCEVFVRAQESYERFLNGGGPLGKTSLADLEQAARMINHGIGGHSGDCREDLANNRYRPFYISRLKERANAIWNAQVCK